MRGRLSSLLSGDSLRARSMRGTGLTVLSFGGARVLRLGSNLILTRLLFPEAFGLMALVQVFMAGLEMFSDIGVNTSILQNKRGDEEDFLNTAWTMQIIRGGLLWLASCALALPAAAIYDEPMLAVLLPVVGLNAIVRGFTTTNVASANRHMQLGRQTMIDLGCQTLGIIILVALAYYIESVWALVIGGLASNLLKTSLFHMILPGIRNRLHWDWDIAWSLFGFGKYIFLATVAGFLISQGDRAVLGAYVSMAELGIYNVGMLLGTLPLILGQALSNKIILPLYRMRPPDESAQNRRQITRARILLIGGIMGMCTVLAYGGIALTDVLYDDRYALAGPVIVLFSLSVIPQLISVGYTGVLLAYGNSRANFLLTSTNALIQVVFLLIGVRAFGMFGAIIAPGLATLATYPLRVWYVSRYKANNHLVDLSFLCGGAALNGFACWLHWDQIQMLFP